MIDEATPSDLYEDPDRVEELMEAEDPKCDVTI